MRTRRGHARKAIDVGRARVGCIAHRGVFCAGDNGVLIDADADAELVKFGAVIGDDNRLLVPHIYVGCEYIGPAITSGASKYARPEVRRADHNRVALDADALPELVPSDAVAGRELLLLTPITITVAHEDVGRTRVGSLRVVVQGCADDNLVAVDRDALSELVARGTISRIGAQNLPDRQVAVSV